MESTIFYSNRNRIWLCDLCRVSHRLSCCKTISGVFKSMGIAYNLSWFWRRMRCYGSIYIFLYTRNERENYGWNSSHFWKTRNIAIEKLLPWDITIIRIQYKGAIPDCIWNKYKVSITQKTYLVYHLHLKADDILLIQFHTF